ncbi:hypothetical protein I7I51_08901 [Histoplasma capsulatum]|uniref:Uncharacterized protein n=1 Tax=Ajellomyces capsulatus TaxID=5037 RepID=A0A8A1LZ50_AJECA|nr:hypothetical protein I7I51_08901 [Histoplasma capsulatum]
MDACTVDLLSISTHNARKAISNGVKTRVLEHLNPLPVDNFKYAKPKFETGTRQGSKSPRCKSRPRELPFVREKPVNGWEEELLTRPRPPWTVASRNLSSVPNQTDPNLATLESKWQTIRVQRLPHDTRALFPARGCLRSSNRYNFASQFRKIALNDFPLISTPHVNANGDGSSTRSFHSQSAKPAKGKELRPTTEGQGGLVQKRVFIKTKSVLADAETRRRVLASLTGDIVLDTHISGERLITQASIRRSQSSKVTTITPPRHIGRVGNPAYDIQRSRWPKALHLRKNNIAGWTDSWVPSSLIGWLNYGLLVSFDRKCENDLHGCGSVATFCILHSLRNSGLSREWREKESDMEPGWQDEMPRRQK